ncbi:MAG: ABC transporter permease [Spirochaetales bacterium]|nr:ABC transporter permease [Spirochaetales bacterium]
MTFLKIAFLNMIKHPKRSFLVIFVVMVSVVAMIFIGGMFEGMRTRFYETLLQESGHLQVHNVAYKNRKEPESLQHTLEDPQQFTGYLTSQVEIMHAEAIIHFGTKILYKGKNLFILGQGVHPDTAYYGKVRSGIVEGGFLSSNEDILISSRIAELLGCSPGEYLHLAVDRSYGSPYYQDYRVKGIFKTDSREFDDYNIFITHADAQETLYLPDQTIKIRANISDPALTEEFKKKHQSWFSAHHAEIETWKDIHGSFVVLIELFDFFMLFMNIFILVVAATVITNTILMSVFERIGEFGTLRSIGLKKHHIFSMILSEGVCQGIAGGILGLAFGIPLLLWVSQTGIDMGEAADAMKMGSTFPFAFSFSNTLAAFLFGIGVSVAGSVYAGFVNIRLKLIDTLRAS